MQGYFILSYDTDIDIKTFLSDFYSNSFGEYVNYFVTKEYQYQLLLCLKHKGLYDNKNSTFTPALTCDEEKKIISELNLEEKRENLAVFTIIDLFEDVVDYVENSIKNSEMNIHFYSQPIICTLLDLPFETDTNYRNDLSINSILCLISTKTISHHDFEPWESIGFVNNLLLDAFGKRYMDFLKEYSEYLISYCEYTEDDLTRIYSQKEAFAKQIKNDIHEEMLQRDFDIVNSFFCSHTPNTPNMLKCKIYLFHMLMNNLFVHYGYEIVYVLLYTAIYCSENI